MILNVLKFLDFEFPGGVLSLEIPILFSVPISMERKCPKCGRDYSHDPYWTTALRKHLLRKNPCDRSPDVKYIRGLNTPCREVFSLESSIMNVSELPVRYDTWTWFFHEFVKDERNICFVKPNKSKNEIIVKVNNRINIVTFDEFIKLFFNLVIIKWFPNNPDVETSLISDLNYDLESRKPWDGVYTLQEMRKDGTMKQVVADFYIEMKRVMLNYMHVYPDKTGLKNLLTLSINEEN
jgi:hypothetical protein